MGKAPDTEFKWRQDFYVRKKGKRVRRSEKRKEKAGQEERHEGEKGPKLEQEAMFINNLADPQAPDTKYSKYCWDTVLCRAKEEQVKWCGELPTFWELIFWEKKKK